jgi:hypothetical protein
MNVIPLDRLSVFAHIVAIALACLIGIGLPVVVTGMFQHDGSPFERLVIAGVSCIGAV